MRLTELANIAIDEISVQDAEAPKNETLAEHREHCVAKPGNCPFEKEADKVDSIVQTNSTETVSSTSGNENEINYLVSLYNAYIPQNEWYGDKNGKGQMFDRNGIGFRSGALAKMQEFLKQPASGKKEDIVRDISFVEGQGSSGMYAEMQRWNDKIEYMPVTLSWNKDANGHKVASKILAYKYKNTPTVAVVKLSHSFGGEPSLWMMRNKDGSPINAKAVVNDINKHYNVGAINLNGEAEASDESVDIRDEAIDMQKHDKQFHNGHFDPETQSCSLRDDQAKSDDTDTNVSQNDHRRGGMVTPEDDAAYADAVKRGDRETARRMIREAAAKAMPNTKVLDKDGMPKVLYRSKNDEYNVFDKKKLKGDVSGTGFWFTDKTAALSYSKTGDVRAVFLNIENLKSISAGEQEWDEIVAGYKTTDEDGNEYVFEKKDEAKKWISGNDNSIDEIKTIFSTTNDIAKQAKREGFGGCLIEAVVDGGHFGERDWQDQYVAFESNQIKSADITYDDAGNLIPLSKRFNFESVDIRDEAIDMQKHDKQFHNGHFDPETQSCSLRDDQAKSDGTDTNVSQNDHRRGGMVTPEEDAAYADAVKRGDRETALRMMREAAAKAMPNTKVVDKDGLPMVVYHGAVRGGFNVFDFHATEDANGNFFSNSRGVASRYGGSETYIPGRVLSSVAKACLETNTEESLLRGWCEINDWPPSKIEKVNRWGKDGYAIVQIDKFNGISYFNKTKDGILDDLRKNIKREIERLKDEEKDKRRPMVYQCFLNIQNPLVVDANGGDDNSFQYGGERYSVETLHKLSRNRGYDGTIVENVIEYGTTFRSIDFVIDNPSQIKSADITYDDAGNLIPLSKRFNFESVDIRDEAIDMQKHDKQYHGGEFDPEHQSCSLRDKQAKNDKGDAAVSASTTPAAKSDEDRMKEIFREYRHNKMRSDKWLMTNLGITGGKNVTKANGVLANWNYGVYDKHEAFKKLKKLSSGLPKNAWKPGEKAKSKLGDFKQLNLPLMTKSSGGGSSPFQFSPSQSGGFSQYYHAQGHKSYTADKHEKTGLYKTTRYTQKGTVKALAREEDVPGMSAFNKNRPAFHEKGTVPDSLTDEQLSHFRYTANGSTFPTVGNVDGRNYIVKHGILPDGIRKNANLNDHLAKEVAADRFIRAAGLNAPVCKTFERTIPAKPSNVDDQKLQELYDAAFAYKVAKEQYEQLKGDDKATQGEVKEAKEIKNVMGDGLKGLVDGLGKDYDEYKKALKTRFKDGELQPKPGPQTELVKIAEYVDGGVSLVQSWFRGTKAQQDKMRQQVIDAYPVMSFLHNYDAFRNDNILVDKDYNLWFIDNGGCFDYRAQGGKKLMTVDKDGNVDTLASSKNPNAKPWYYEREDPTDYDTGYFGLLYSPDQRLLQDILSDVTDKELVEAAKKYDFTKLVKTLPADIQKPSVVEYAKKLDEVVRNPPKGWLTENENE